MRGHVTQMAVFIFFCLLALILAVAWAFFLIKAGNPAISIKKPFFTVLSGLLLIAGIFFGILLIISYLVKKHH